MRLVVIGLGYTGAAIATLAARAGIATAITSRRPGATAPHGVDLLDFASAGPAIAAATHLIATAAPDQTGDPTLSTHGDAIVGSTSLAWLGYLSTTGVYGDRGGAWVDEATLPAPTAARSHRRLAAEQAWQAAAAARPLDLFRVAGIYGPGRSAFDELRRGQTRRIASPGHKFGRIHRDDIAAAILAAIHHPPVGPSPRVLNLSDDEPAESADVTAQAARLLGLPVPPAIPLEMALPAMSDMARSFWAESRLVSSKATQAALHLTWRYPSYREGLAAILAEERTHEPVE